MVMSVEQERSDYKPSADNRTAERNAVQMFADLRLGVGQKFKVSVLDLSRTGFRLETGNHIDVGKSIFITIPDFTSLAARIAWNHGTIYGCEFTSPLHQSVFEHIARKHPAITN